MEDFENNNSAHPHMFLFDSNGFNCQPCLSTHGPFWSTFPKNDDPNSLSSLGRPESLSRSLSPCSSWSSFDEDDPEYGAHVGPDPHAHSRIKSKLEARDRDNEIGYLLKRQSLQLSRQSSLNTDFNPTPAFGTMSHHRPLARTDSSSSVESTASLTLAKPSTRVLQLARYLRGNCDQILSRSQTFVIDSSLLWLTAEAINAVHRRVPSDEDSPAWSDYENQVLFLSDFLSQTPSLSISPSAEGTPVGSIDLTLFVDLKFLDLRKVSPSSLSGLNTIRIHLQKLKWTRSLESLTEIFSEPGESASGLTSVWRELRDLDLSSNQISYVDIRALEVTPSVESLNLSRNRISSIDPCFSRLLTCLTVLNLNYNQLTTLPPLPPNLKVLLLNNNYISTLANLTGSLIQLETLDLSQNMISDERTLEPLRHLSALKSLAFLGNPITYADNYRSMLCSNLNRLVVTTKGFELDKVTLSNSEIKTALEQIKRYRPPLVLSPSNPLYMTKSANPLANLQSLSQSYDSNSSSSVRSACRKKARIREVVILDSDSVETVDVKSKRKGSGSGSTQSGSSETISVSENTYGIKEKVVSLIERHGQENWLLRQSGNELKKLCNIREPAYVEDFSMLSKSLPSSRGDNTSFYSAVSQWDTNSSEKTTPTCQTEAESSSSTIAVENSLELDSDDSIKRVTDSSNSSDGLLFYSCFDDGTGTKHDETENVDFPNERFSDEAGLAVTFRTFISGQSYKLAILDHYLYEIDPARNDIILTKWDLRSLKNITEKKVFKEAETTEFHLSFDTLRKHWRERSFIMSTRDYAAFESLASKFLRVRTLQEFDGFQCVKCNSQFSRGMAELTIVGKVPREVPICPHCQSEFLLPLESIPLPNNETLSIDEGPCAWGTIRTSTPLSIGKGMSLPGSGFFRSSRENKNEAPSSIGSSQSSPTYPVLIHTAANVSTDSENNNKGSSSDGTSKHTKSDSDIETLSCDSSSIEVLHQNADSGSDDIQVEEGVEILIPDFGVTLGKTPNSSTTNLPMTESNSSGSYAGSICTQYEKTINANLCPISQQLSSRPPIPFPRTSSSVSVTNALSQSPSRGTGLSLPTIPIKYDYVNFAKVDHRLQLFCELSVFKQAEERLLALTKVVVIASNGPFLCLVIFSDKKLYIYKITGVENDKPESWLQKFSSFPISKLSKLDMLISRHGVGLDLSAAGKYYALVFRDSKRTLDFIEFFLSFSDVLVQDFSQTHKALMSPNNPIAYFGILRSALCEVADHAYPVSAIVLTDEELILVADLSWLVNRGTETVSVKHERKLTTLRQVECLEMDVTFVKLVFELDTHVFWDIYFETEEEKDIFIRSLRAHTKDVPFISLSQPLEP